MSSYIFPRRRRWLGALVLLALLATLLPTHDASAQQQQIVLTPSEVRTEVYERWLNTKWPGTIRGGDLLLTNLVYDRIQNDPNIDPQVLFAQADALQQRFIKQLGPGGSDPAYRNSLSPRLVNRTMLAAALATPDFRANAKWVYNTERAVYQAGIGNQSEAYAKSFTEGNLLAEAARTLQRKQVSAIVKRVQADPQFGAVWHKHFAPSGGPNLLDFDAKSFILEHPELYIPQEIQNAIKPDGSLAIEVAELDKLTKNALDTINAAIDDTQKTVGAISKEQGELVDFENDPAARATAQAIAEAKYIANQRKLEAASSAVSIVSTLVGLKYPERGKQIAVVGQSAIQIGEALNGWMLATAGLTGLSKLGSLSTVAMTGNVLGAVMNVVSLFGPQQPTPEQLILEEIGKMRQQLNELRTEMHTRFDQIDKQLNTIYTAMNDRFNLIDIQLGKINGKLDEIQQSLLNLSIALDRLERNNVEYLDAIGRRPLREAMNGALDYKERTGVDMLYQPDFVNYENIFHTWGTINAFDALSAGPSERNYSDGQVLAELNAAPLDANVNYLNGWLQAHGMQTFATKRLASPRDWAFASRAYAQLGQDWPEHLKRIGAGRQAALDAVGNDLEQALASISTIQTASGPQGNAPLWNELIAYYRSKQAALDRALLDSETAFVKDLQTQLNRPVGFNPYGGLDQSLSYQPTDFATMTCGGGYAAHLRVAAPQNLKNMVPAYNRYALADYLGLNTTAVCWYPELVDKFVFCQGGVCEEYGFVTVLLVVKSPMGEVAQRTFRGYPAKWGSDVRQLVVNTWAGIYRPKIESELAGITPQPSDTTAITSKLAVRLNEYQRTYALRVQGELTRGQLGAMVVELAGAKKLLESFVTLGFPQAVGSDDLLRSLLFSKEALVDDQQVALAYTPPPALDATAVISEAQLLVNPRVKLHETGTKRSEALSSLLTDYLSSISIGTYREDNALLGGTRFDMVMARSMADPNAPLPGESHVIFLPLVQH